MQRRASERPAGIISASESSIFVELRVYDIAGQRTKCDDILFCFIFQVSLAALDGEGVNAVPMLTQLPCMPSSAEVLCW